MRVLRYSFYAAAAVMLLASASLTAAETEVKKTGIITGISYSSAEKKVTLSVSLGTLKKPGKPDKNVPPAAPDAEDMIELSGETVTVSLSSDTALKMAGTDGDIVPAPHDKDGPDQGPAMMFTVKNIKIDDLVALVYSDDGVSLEDVALVAVLPPAGGTPGEDHHEWPGRGPDAPEMRGPGAMMQSSGSLAPSGMMNGRR